MPQLQCYRSAVVPCPMVPPVFQMPSIRKPGKIVIVSQYFAPDPSTTATYITAIAEGLTTDCEVLVISGTAHSASAAPLKSAQPRVIEIRTWTPEKMH